MPGEFSMDETAVLQVGEVHKGRVSAVELKDDLGWTSERSRRGLESLLRQGLAWIDGTDQSYWIPSIFSSLKNAKAAL